MKAMYQISLLSLVLTFFMTGCLNQEKEGTTQTRNENKADYNTNPDKSYDPKKITPTIINSKLQHERIMHQAIKLNDGRVFVVGGGSETTEIYDPKTDTWSAGPTAIGFCTFGDNRSQAQLLNDGRVFVICGYQTNVYIFDLEQNNVKVVAQLSHSRNGASVTKLTNGELLIVGGVNETSYLTAHRYQDAEIFNPNDNNLHNPSNDLQYGKAGHSAILDNAGRVYLFGGNPDQQLSTNYEIFETWFAFNAAGGIYQNRSHAHPFILPSGKILLAGGHFIDDIGYARASLLVEEYGIYQNGVEKNQLPRGFYESAAAQLPDGSPILTGGDDVTNSTGRNEIYIYNFTTEKFELTGYMQEARKQHTATVLDNGDLLVVGGRGKTGALASAERIPSSLYSPQTVKED